MSLDNLDSGIISAEIKSSPNCLTRSRTAGALRTLERDELLFITKAGINVFDKLQDGSVPVRGINDHFETVLNLHSLRERKEGEFFSVLEHAAIGERPLRPNLDTDKGCRVFDFGQMSNEICCDAAACNARDGKLLLVVYEMQICEVDLSCCRFMRTDGDTEELALSIIELVPGLVGAAILGKMTATDIKTGYSLRGGTFACEIKGVVHDKKI